MIFIYKKKREKINPLASLDSMDNEGTYFFTLILVVSFDYSTRAFELIYEY